MCRVKERQSGNPIGASEDALNTGGACCPIEKPDAEDMVHFAVAEEDPLWTQIG